MKILKEEIKKIWRPRIVLLLIVFIPMYYILFCEFYFISFESNYVNANVLDTYLKWMDKYGDCMDKAEWKEASLQVKEVEKEMRACVQDIKNNDPTLNNVKIETYRDMTRTNVSKEHDKVHEMLFDDSKYNNIGWKLQNIVNIVEYTKDHTEIIPPDFLPFTFELIKPFIIGVVFTLLMFLSPLLVFDTHRNVNPLQISSKVGRKLYRKQFQAVLFSGFILTTIELIAIGTLCENTGMLAFLNQPINSEIRFQITFRQYLLLIVAMIYIISFTIIGISFILSKFSKNYIALCFKVVLVFIATTFITNTVFELIFIDYNPLYEILSFSSIEFLLCTVLLTGVICCVIIIGIKEKRRELY